MLRGRHRGLPVAIDRAVLLKGHDFPDNVDDKKEQLSEPTQAAETRDSCHPDTNHGREICGGEKHHIHNPFKHPHIAGSHEDTNGPVALAEHLMASPDAETGPILSGMSSELGQGNGDHKSRLDTVPESPAPSSTGPLVLQGSIREQEPHEDEDTTVSSRA